MELNREGQHPLAAHAHRHCTFTNTDTQSQQLSQVCFQKKPMSEGCGLAGTGLTYRHLDPEDILTSALLSLQQCKEENYNQLNSGTNVVKSFNTML